MFKSDSLGDFVQGDADMECIAFIDLREPENPREWTYGEFDAAVSGIARGLARRGLQQGDRVAIMAGNRAEFMQVYFGVMRAGMVAVPINFKLPKDTINFLFEDASVSLVFVDGQRAHLCPDTCAFLNFDEQYGDSSFALFMDPGPFTTIRPVSGATSKILYTSGSSGRPKGVLLDHEGQIWALDLLKSMTANNNSDEQSSDNRLLVVAPTYHKNGLLMSTLQLRNHGTIVSLPKFEAATYIETAAKFACQTLGGIPTMFAMVTRLEDKIAQLDLSGVKTVLMGSAPVTEVLMNRVKQIFPNAIVKNTFGTTEAGAAVFGAHPEGMPTPPLSFGCRLSEIELKLVDGPSSKEGVLHIKGPALMTGYLNLPEITAEKIVDGWYNTGDVMREDQNGFYFFVGRADDMFVCGGENVYPGEVEKMLEQCPGVAQAVIVSIPHDIKGQIPIAFIVKNTDSKVTADDIKKFALDNGPAYSHPRFVYFKNSIPLAGTQKVDYRVLTEQAKRLTEGT